MSLINQMLRDLEERRADELTRQNLQREIRPLPPAPRPARAWWLVSLVGLIGLGGAGWLVYAQWPSTVTEAPPPVAAPSPLSPLPVPPAAAPEAAPVVPAEAMLPREVEPPAGLDGLRLTVALQTLPVEAAVPAATPIVPAPETPAKAAVQNPVPSPAKPVGNVPKAAVEVPAGPGSVEKSASLATPRERADADYRKAQAAATAGRVAETVEALQAALRQDPGHVPARQALIRTLVDQRHLEEAETVLRDGLEQQPAQVSWAMSLARLQVERNDWPAALKTLGRSAAFGARSADYQGFTGHVEHRLGHYRDAIVHYQGATRLAPAEGRWWLGLGLALEADGQGGEAKEAFRRALASGNLATELAAIAEARSH